MIDYLNRELVKPRNSLTHQPKKKLFFPNSPNIFFCFFFSRISFVSLVCVCVAMRLVINLFRSFFFQMMSQRSLIHTKYLNVFVCTHHFLMIRCERTSIILTFYGHCLFPFLTHTLSLNISIGKLSSIFYIHLFLCPSNIFPASHLTCHSFVHAEKENERDEWKTEQKKW